MTRFYTQLESSKVWIRLKQVMKLQGYESRTSPDEVMITYIHVHVYMYMYNIQGSVFDKLIWHTIGPKSFLFGAAQFSLWASGTVNYHYIVTNSINSLLIGSRCIPNGTHINHC